MTVSVARLLTEGLVLSTEVVEKVVVAKQVVYKLILALVAVSQIIDLFCS